MTLSRKKTFRILLILVSIGLGVALASYLSKIEMRRFYAFAGYQNALEHFVEIEEKAPGTINELETTYNAFERRRTALPAPPWFLRPEYRPTDNMPGGPYLVLIENKPSVFTLPTRFIIYSNGNGSGRYNTNVWEWQLDDLIRRDDELRKQNQPPQLKSGS